MDEIRAADAELAKLTARPVAREVLPSWAGDLLDGTVPAPVEESEMPELAAVARQLREFANR
jgi:hypothetical protein